MRTEPRGVIINEYIRHTDARLKQLTAAGYQIKPEPVSALFATQAEVRVLKVLDSSTPELAAVDSSVKCTWRPEAEVMMQKLDGHSIPYRQYGRSGGPYHLIPNKRIAKWKKFEKTLIDSAAGLWNQSWWQDDVKYKFVQLLDTFEQRTYHNIETLLHEPELLTVGKDENVGTGWKYPLSTRGEMVTNIRYHADSIKPVIEEYYRELKKAITDHWPKQDVQINLGGTYRGIEGGVRSAVDVIGWSHNLMELRSTSREVGNDPSSAFHGPGLNPYQYRSQLWRQFSSIYHLMPDDTDGLIDTMLAPLATMDGDPNDMVLLSADAGYGLPGPSATERVVNPGSDKISFGADQVSLSGIFLRTAEGLRIAMLKSGTPYTMLHYNIIFGEAIAYYARLDGLTLSMYQIGDDLQIKIKRGDIPVLLARLGPWLRLKGMSTNTVFVLGHRIHWLSEDEIVVYIVPRALKSLTSPRGVGAELPAYVKVGDTYITKVNPEVEASIGEYWEQFPDLIYVEGTPRDVGDRLKRCYDQGQMELSKLGVSEWYQEMFHDRSPAERPAVGHVRGDRTIAELL